MELIAKRSRGGRALKVAAVLAVVGLTAYGCGSSNGSAQSGGSGGSVEVMPITTANQSCETFAPEDELGTAISATVRFEPTSGGSEAEGWGCWYYVNNASLNNLLVDVSSDVEQGRRMVSEKEPREDIRDLGGAVYLSEGSAGSQIFVIRENGFFYVSSESQDDKPPLTEEQLIAAAHVVAGYLSA